MKNNTFFITHHQNKGKFIQQCLIDHGWRYSPHKPMVALFDHTLNRNEPSESRTIIKRFAYANSVIMTYPHGATGAWWLDGEIVKPDNNVNFDLVIGEGQKKVAEIIDPSTPHEVIGWYLCPQKKFEKINKVKRIVFASIHPPEKSTFRPEAYKANVSIYRELEKLANSGKYQIVIRHINSLKANGLGNSSKIIYVSGKPDGDYKEIDLADVVIAEGTYMYMSVARGKPTIGINQHVPIRPNSLMPGYEPKKWNEYGEYMAYPINYQEGKLQELIDRAISEEQTDWRNKFIGFDTTSEGLNKKILELYNKARS